MLQPINDPKLCSAIAQQVSELVRLGNGEGPMLLMQAGWVAVLLPPAYLADLDARSLLAYALERQGVAKLIAVPLGDRALDHPRCYAVPVNADAIAQVDVELLNPGYLLFNRGAGFALLRGKGYLVLAGSPRLLEQALGNPLALVRAAFADYARGQGNGEIPERFEALMRMYHP